MLTHECKGNASYKHLSIKQENIDLYYKNKPRIFATVPKCIKIKELYGNVVRVPVLSVDSVIFDIIGKKIDNERFCNEAESCLDDSFPIDKKQEFNDFLWKRISLLVSYGLLVVSKSSL